MNETAPLVVARDLAKSFRSGTVFGGGSSSVFRAVDRLSLEIFPGETLSLVGESGCGKTTVGRLLLRLLKPSSGKVFFEGSDLESLSAAELRARRAQLQIIFQDPYGSLNPRFTVYRTLAEPLRIHERLSGGALSRRIQELLELVGLSADHAGRYPHEFSGGQRQRIAIARAVSVNPRFVVADEPVSALDLSVQGQIINLLIELQQRIGMAMLFISHDLSVVRAVSDRVAVMYRGRLVELAEAGQLYERPLHPYTRLLLESVPGRSRKDAKKGQTGFPEQSIGEEEADAWAGCSFRQRCREAGPGCRTQAPELVEFEPGHWAACCSVTEPKRKEH